MMGTGWQETWFGRNVSGSDSPMKRRAAQNAMGMQSWGMRAILPTEREFSHPK